MARHVIKVAEMRSVKVFPNTSSCWHFGDKIAQKCLLEAIGELLVPAYWFYDLREALRWIDRASFSKVFKLGRGAGPSNVTLAHSSTEARALAEHALCSGFSPVPHQAVSDQMKGFVRMNRWMWPEQQAYVKVS